MLKTSRHNKNVETELHTLTGTCIHHHINLSRCVQLDKLTSDQCPDQTEHLSVIQQLSKQLCL